MLNNKFWRKIRSNLVPNISGNKYDRDKPILSAENVVNQILMRYKIGMHSDRKSQKRGSSLWNLPTMPKYGSTPLPPGMTRAR